MPRARLSRKQVQEAIEHGAKLEQIKKLRPTWDDYVAEGVLDHKPEPGPDGQVEATIQGHDNVVRALQMNREASRLSAWHADNYREKLPMSDEQTERRARKRHRPRAIFIVPEMPWKKGK